ncbi:MAG TPA: DUF411 domain-containing protein [Azospirillum sp.]|nr:DUF411 domain-containing protein [Azospirillum sp.]
MTKRKPKRTSAVRSPQAAGSMLQGLRRGRWLLLLGGALFGVHVLAGSPIFDATPAAAADVTVWKSPTCGCCGKWIEHLRAAGFSVAVHDNDEMHRIKVDKGVPESLQSCHTAVVGGYVVEGHVPASDIQRLLAEKPQVKGLSAPGMPQSSPGMDIHGEPYEVVSFGTDGASRTYARH